MADATKTTTATLIRGGQVYDHDGDVHRPPLADILVENGVIAAVGPGLEAPPNAAIVDATDRLVIPGLINAHYHSHDVLCRGLFEEMPLEMWLLYTLPMSGHRSKEEIRARTLVGALESLRCGITTVQDMLGLVPLTHEIAETVIDAYREIGIRTVFAPMVSDIPSVAMVRHGAELPQEVQEMFGTKALPMADQFDYLGDLFDRHKATTQPLHFAVAPFAPQRCTPKMLEGCACLADKHDLPVYTHVYETKGQALIARDLFEKYDGSLVTYMERAGLLTPRLNIVHSVWIARPEMDQMAQAGAGIVLNHLSNMKLKSGIAPVVDLRESGVRLGLGCDNCSGSDVQSVFQAMKMFCLLSAVSEAEPGPALAHEALRMATLGNAKGAGLEGTLGAIKPGHKADLVFIDLADVAYMPMNSAARQLVYTEAGRGVDAVMVDGRMVVKDRAITTIDADALRREVASLMKHFIADYDAVVAARAHALPHMRDIHRKVWARDLGYERFVGRTR